MKVIYCVDDVLAAAKYIAEHNTLLNETSDTLYKEIIDSIHEHVKDGKCGSFATAGYRLNIGMVGTYTYECDVTMTPHFGESVYVTEEV